MLVMSALCDFFSKVFIVSKVSPCACFQKAFYNGWHFETFQNEYFLTQKLGFRTLYPNLALLEPAFFHATFL